jgi:hypothetical protein
MTFTPKRFLSASSQLLSKKASRYFPKHHQANRSNLRKEPSCSGSGSCGKGRDIVLGFMQL